jgi:translation initiation factor 2 subunit 2
MNYEALLERAHETVKPMEVSERFEVMKVKGHHQGSKTLISNFPQVLSHIRRSQGHVMKFLSKELASQMEFSNGTLTFSRRLSSKDINEKIGKYVQQFVLCKKCKKPDTELTAQDSKTLVKCLACGEKREVHKI